MTPARALSIRALLTIVGVAALAFLAGATIQITGILQPTAEAIRERAADLVSEHDAIATNLRRMREARREVARHVPPLDPGDPPRVPLAALRAAVRALVDSAAGIAPQVERAALPPEMRLLLARAADHETQLGLLILEAIDAMALDRPADAIDALHATGLRSDSSAGLLSAAQRVALGSLLDAESSLLRQLELLLRSVVLWGLGGGLLLLLAVWVIRTRITGPVGELERAVRRISAGELHAEVSVTRLDELGRLGAHLNAMTGVLRERADAEARRRENLTERFGRLLDESSNEICVFDATSLRAMQVNRGARLNLGYPPEALEALTLPDLLREHDPAELRGHLERLRRGEQDRLFLTTRQTRRDGSTYPVEMSVQYLREGDDAVFVTVSEDAAVRHRVRELDERLREFALAQQRLLAPGDLPRTLEAIVRMAADALREVEVGIWRGRGGRMRRLVWHGPGAPPGSVATGTPGGDPGGSADGIAREHPSAPPADPDALVVPVATAAKDPVSLVVRSGEGSRAWSAEERTFVGAVAGLIGRALDAADRRDLEQALARAQRMESIGQLAGGIAHDFNNILTAILGNLESVRLDLSPGDPIDASLADAERAARRAADLTRQLLTFARHQPVEFRVFDPNALARDAERMLERLVGANVSVRTALDPAVRPVRMGPGQFEQVLVNLVVNARDAMPDGGTVTVSTRNVDLGAPAPDARHPLAAGPYVELAVADTGTGIAPDALDRIFEPFYTTKGPGEGTGLGLAVCFGIVQQVGGAIRAESVPGRGATFRVLLPAAPEAAVAAAALQRAPSRGGDESILVVEDERPIRELIARALRLRGYRVLQAEDGRAALGLLGPDAASPDLLVSDVMMPNLGGAEVAALLRVRFPALPVLFISGYTADALHDPGLVADAEFLAKPFTPEELARRVREILDRRADADGAEGPGGAGEPGAPAGAPPGPR